MLKSAPSVGTENSLNAPGPSSRPSLPLKRFWPALPALAAGAVVVLALRPGGTREQRIAAMDLPELKRAAAAKDADPLVHVVYGEKLARRNLPTAALEEFRSADRMLQNVQRDPLEERVYSRLGYTLAYMGDEENARPYLDRARRLNSNNWLVTAAEGAILIRKHDARRAVTQCLRAVALRPQSYEAHYILGLAYNDARDAKAAENELKRAVALAPDYGPAQAELGHAFAFQSQYSKAAEQFRIARQLDPQSSDYLFALGEALGMEARSAEQYRDAVAVQTECMRASPSNAALLFTLGQLHLRFMNLDRAYDCLLKASALRPKHAKAWYNLARVAELLGDSKEARIAYERFNRQILLRDKAIVAEKRVSANLKDARARLELSRRFHAEGNLKGCYVQLRAALAIDPGLTDAQVELGLLQSEFQRLLDQNGAMASKSEENNATGPPGPEEALSSVTEKTDGPQQ